MVLKPLASSSEGNSTYIHTENTRILIDAGVSMKKIFELSNQNSFDALIVTHEHSDHIKSAGSIGRKTKCPIYLHKLVYEKKKDLFKNCDIKFLDPGNDLIIGDFTIKVFSTKHDSIYTFGFLIKDNVSKKSLCYLTDTGTITPLMRKHMQGADAYLIEADYDLDMLMNYSGYTDFLKERINSNYGHLSNEETMETLKSIGIEKTSHIIFAHLSPRTNTPEKVLGLANQYFPDYSGKFMVAPLDHEVEL
jgi:phosphoribosyl 1,2-cyclic phosphodiesterase